MVRVLESWPPTKIERLFESNAAHSTTNKEFHTIYEFLREDIEYIRVCAMI